MQYKELVNKLREIAETYKGSLYFGVGTLNELNKGCRNYPLLWVQTPTNIQNIVSNGQHSQNINLTLQFLQSGSINISEEEETELYNETLNILNGFIGKITVLNDEENDTWTFGTATQIYRKGDDTRTGWSQPVTINAYVDTNLCCNLFE